MEEIESIPRVYEGITFRSTLEASWAIMFDKLGWDWEYEPFRLHGWIPDFVLQGEILVEVKPNDDLDEFIEYEKYNSSTDGTRFECADILLLGRSPIANGDLHETPAIGWLVERPNDQRHHAIIWDTELGYGFASDYSNWRCRITGAYEGGAGIVGADWRTIRQMWLDSCREAKALDTDAPPDWPYEYAD